MSRSPLRSSQDHRFGHGINLRVSRVGMEVRTNHSRALVAVHDVHASLPRLTRPAGIRPLPGVREICRAAARDDFEHLRSVGRECETSKTVSRLKAWGLALLLAAVSLTGTATNRDTETEQATADTVTDVAAHAEQLQVDLLFAEVRP